MKLLRQVIIVGACLSVAAGAASPAGAQTQQQIDWCVNEGNIFSPDLSIGGCTAAIQSGRWSGKDLAWAFNNRCWAYSEKSETDRAIADCTDAIWLDPNYATAFINRGNAYRNKGDYDRAIADFSEVIRLDPNIADAYNNRGHAYSENKKDYDRAIADYNAAIRLKPNKAAIYYNRGHAYASKGDYDRAIADYREAIRLIQTIPLPSSTAATRMPPRVTTTAPSSTTARQDGLSRTGSRYADPGPVCNKRHLRRHVGRRSKRCRSQRE